MALFLIATMLYGQNQKFFGFIDQNRDGINDNFCDANGDGINDVNRRSYAHKFEFRDENRDGINDLFIDVDGDGVNDLAKTFVDHDSDGWNDNVIDINQDWINDITGLVYDLRHFRGGRFGLILEEIGIRVANYVDADNDGCFDNMPQYRRRMMRDQFIDKDGDGLFDGRGFNRHRKKGFQNKGRK